VVTYTVVVATDNTTGKLLPYLTANVQFEVSRRQGVLLIPNAAMRWRPQLAQVAPDAREAYAKSRRRGDRKGEKPEQQAHDRATLWIEDEGFVRPVTVKIGLGDGIQTEILSDTLKEGDQVVIGETRQKSEGTVNPFTPQMFGGGKKKD